MGLSEKRDFKTKVIVLIGRPGTGKSRLANEISKYVYEDKSHDKRWWDGCDEETECVIIDDFYGLLKYDELLKITDRYPYKVPVKGAYVNFEPKCIGITSNALIANWYRFPGYQTDALSRRIEHLFLEEIPDICQFFENKDYHNKDALNKPVKTSEK